MSVLGYRALAVAFLSACAFVVWLAVQRGIEDDGRDPELLAHHCDLVLVDVGSRRYACDDGVRVRY